MPKKMYVGVDNFTQRTLPSAYTQLEYIETDGASHIDTGITPDQNTRIDMDFEILSTTVNPSVLFGVRTSSGGTPYFGVVYLGTYLRFDYGTAQKTLTPSSLTSRVNLSVNKNVFSFGSSSVTNTENTFTCGNTMFLFSYSNGGTQNSPVKARLYSCQIYDNGTLVRDYIPAESSGGVIGLYDAVSGGFSRNGGSGAFTAGPTYKGVARQVKKGYFGVDDVARKIKKGYIGVGGVARPFFTGGELTYYGTATALSTAVADLAATTVGDYALFAGGTTSSGNSNAQTTTYAYNKALTKSTPTALGSARADHAATTIGSYALFAGGQKSSYYKTCEVYNDSLTRSSATSLSVAVYGLNATTIGSYALFAGGRSSDGYENTVNVYNTSLTKSTATSLSTARMDFAAASVGDYALFAGGLKSTSWSSGVVTTVDAYNSSLTKSAPTVLSNARGALTATTVGDYALIGGGYKSSGAVTTVDVYNESLTRSTATALTKGGRFNAATTLGEYAIFGGGADGSSVFSAVDAYDTSLTKTNTFTLNTARFLLAAATVGNYALFAGGRDFGGTPYNVVDAYIVD